MIGVRLQTAPFDIATELAALRAGRTDIGALVSFTGLVRDGDGDGAQKITSMTLEHYPAMTEKELRAIAAVASQRWDLIGGIIVHRFGTLKPADDIVLVATASAHRQAAFESAMFLMDWLKTKAPFWKKETGSAGAHWVDAKAADDAAAEKWHDRDSGR
jgi:molybdopterin synthase catalytic subunit